MQSKGAIRFVAILLLFASLWQLSFTLVNQIQENKAEKYADAKAEAAMQTAAFEKVSEADRANYLDSLKKVENRRYIDSISAEKIYFGYTFKDVQAKSINLGLDLKGGMNVMLQVQLKDLVRALAGYSEAPEFTKALELAQERSVNSRQDFITLFAEAWNETSNGMPLAQIFGTYEMRDKIGPESTNEQVIEVIRAESESAVSNSFNVLRNRIDRFGVTSPNIQKLGNSGRILVELPGVKEPERVRKLLQGTASLEFWTTYTYNEIESYLVEANNALAQMQAVTGEVVADAKATEGDDLLAEELQQNAEDAVAEAQYRQQNPLFSVLQLSGATGSACIGYAHYADTAQINRYFEMPQIKQLFPREFQPKWAVKASEFFEGGNIFELVAIKSSSRDGKAPLDGGSVADASVQYGNNGEINV